jgi:hypothetical protein
MDSDAAAPIESETWYGSRKPFLQLLLLSMSALFLELAFIRWIPGSVRVAGYFTNMILIASFLGLGTGAILSRFDRDLFRWWPVTFFALAFSTLIFGALGQTNPPGESEFIWAGGPWHALDENIGWLWSLNTWLWDSVAGPLDGLSFYVVITTIFVLTAAHFTLLGHRIGHLFAVLPPLRAYGYDLGGSLLGILLFTLVSRLSAPPIAWFVLGAGGLAVLSSWRGLRGVISVMLVLASLVLVLASSHSYHWSPYYKIEVSAVDENMAEGVEPVANPRQLGYRVRVNNDYHQTALDLSPTAADVDFVRNWRDRYDAPYTLIKPGRVLVLGAGSGNDVQAALRNGATHVTAVEIDPALAALGRSTHPERPYADSRVSLVVDDARSFLKRSTDTFDTIVYGFLDSHTLMTSFSTLRIDNYVYTVQGLSEAFARLNPGGHIALSFASVRPFLGSRLHRMIALAGGFAPDALKMAEYGDGSRPPLVTRVPPFGHLLVVPRSANWSAPDPLVVEEKASRHDRWLSTDSWPFLYLQEPAIPTHYLYFMALVILLGLLSFSFVDAQDRRLNLEFFFLGAGFLLLETRSVTEIALLFGSTWEVNSVAFGGVLAAVLLANIIVERRGAPPLPWLYVGIIAMLFVGYLLPPGVLYVESVPLRLLFCALVLYTPIFLAGLVFSTRFRGTDKPNLLFGSNLLGAMSGGALEYLSLVLGLPPLYLVGAALYLAAFSAGRRVS